MTYEPPTLTPLGHVRDLSGPEAAHPAEILADLISLFGPGAVAEFVGTRMGGVLKVRMRRPLFDDAVPMPVRVSRP